MKSNIYSYTLPALLFSSTISVAGTGFISPNGTGNGYSIDKPASINSVNTLLSDPNLDTIKLMPGTYIQEDAIYLRGGSHDIQVIGDEQVIFSGDYNFTPEGNAGFVIARSNISFENLQFLNTRYCFRFKNYNVTNVKIDKITAHNTMSCIDFDSNITATVENIVVNNVKSLGYFKSGVRINGKTPRNISITNSIFDALASSSEETKSCHITGISVSGFVEDILIKNVTITNNIGAITNCGEYQQGDGVMVNADASNVSIVNTVVGNSKDADFDIKGKNTTLLDVTSLSGKEARYNMKLWNNDFTCKNCYIHIANINAIQAIDAKVNFMNSTFKVNDHIEICDLRNYTDAISSVTFANSHYSSYGELSIIPEHVDNCIK
ncbi:hypothetical protein NQT69_00455 [Pseudoalteromonas shioyasakiensis]|uniref:hypothetical protein n=1 Tax=Pseudoalteromonas shioyasakiensis TaxID=1190813 RepID=UPI0021180879|nr:hypothetical protein [Pseudoalteromonas shioyasakiensis]MCQ8876511.1 hypothetical protein [Pseudoalteromonas shioyasakiensis]